VTGQEIAEGLLWVMVPAFFGLIACAGPIDQWLEERSRRRDRLAWKKREAAPGHRPLLRLVKTQRARR
jgi:hypothetical protein